MKLKRFDEVKVNLPLLNRTDRDYGQRFVKRLKNKEKFTIKADGETKISMGIDNAEDVVDKITIDDDKYDPASAKRFFMPTGTYSNVLQGEDDNLYKLTDLEKDADFGSSKGTSLGLEGTRQVESIQCLFFALKQSITNRERINRSDLDLLYDSNGDIRKDLMSCVSLPIELDGPTLKQMLTGDKEKWIDTFLNTSNAIYNTELQLVGKEYMEEHTIRRVLSKNKRYHFHQIGSTKSPIIQAINVGYDCPETEGISISKWTPSDVWAVEHGQESTIIQQLRSCVTIDELNKVINERYQNRTLIGISLKKVGGEESIKLVINKLTKPPKFTFASIFTSKKSLGSMGVKLIANVESELGKDLQTMYLRSFSGSNKVSSITGEVDGSHSRYGKIGLTWINQILAECGITEDERIPTGRQIQKDKSLTNEVLIGEISKMNDLIPNKVSPTNKSITGRGSLVSKYQALKFGLLMQRLSDDRVMYFDENTRQKTPIVDKITQDMFDYAMAIRNYSFVCPMYVRIITTKK